MSKDTLLMLSKRRVLRVVAGTAFALGILFSTDAGSAEVQSQSTLFRATDRFSKSSIYDRTAHYPKDLDQNRIYGLGDSNESGGTTTDPIPLSFYVTQEIRNRYGKNFEYQDLASYGQTTVDTRYSQLNDPRLANFKGSFDVILNVGADDVEQAVNTQQKANKVNELSQNLSNPLYLPKLLDLTGDISQRINKMGQNFELLTDTLFSKYRGRLKHLFVITLPDFGVPNKITTGNNDGIVTSIDNRVPLQKFLLTQGSTAVNNEIIDALNNHTRAYPQDEILAINTFNTSIDGFAGDEHYSKSEQKKIAGQIVDRMIFDGPEITK